MVVDDSPFIRRVLIDILKKDKEIVIVGEARNGKDALKQIPLLRPDVITLDIEMPIMDGMTALTKIVDKYNIPVIMISSLTMEGADLTLKALEQGAIDFIPKPQNIFSLGTEPTRSEIINKIKAVSKSNIDLCHRKVYVPRFPKEKMLKFDPFSREFEYIIAIGTSTGGPRALQNVLPLFPRDINASIVVVQHMPPKFTKSLADRLDTLTNIKVKEGEEGDVLRKGFCYIAPGGFHMRVASRGDKYVLELSTEEPVKGLRPAVDVLMESVAKLKNLKKVAVIMTGMGSDGAEGITEIKRSNGYIIAQNEESSIVFGMPKLAIETGCVDKIVPLKNIAHEVMKVMEV